MQLKRTSKNNYKKIFKPPSYSYTLHLGTGAETPTSTGKRLCLMAS